MYLDIEKKIAFYKEHIRKDFIKNGVFLSDDEITKKIKDLDTNIALFYHEKIKSGATFNTERFNNNLYLIAEDLKILYDVYYKLCNEELLALKNYVYSNLDKVENIVNSFNEQAKYENNSTTLGYTLYYRDKAFNIIEDNSICKILLGEVNINRDSTIACISNIKNINPEFCTFNFLNKSSKELLKSLPYNYNNNILKIPGNQNINTYKYLLDDNQIISSPLLLNIDEEIKNENKYTILGAENKMLVNRKLEDAPINDNIYEALEDIDVQFSIFNGDSVKFYFSQKPLDSNFSINNDEIQNLNSLQVITLKLKKGTLFNFKVNKGSIYAIKENANIIDSKIYFISTLELPTDYLIIEEERKIQDSYDVFLTITHAYEDLDIENIIIKELQ